MAAIHPSAVVADTAIIGAGSVIGPLCYVGPNVVIGANVELKNHVSIDGHTTIGDGCVIYPNAAIGYAPQSVGHKGGKTTCAIGRNTTIRESVTVQAGADFSRGATTVGDDCYLMAYSHVAHDCAVGNNVTMANGVALAGHCEIGDNVTIGGLTAVLQFVRVGNNAFLAGMSAISGDVIPYGLAQGNLAELRGLNVVGMRRAGMTKADVHLARRAYKMVFDRSRPMAENLDVARREFEGQPLAMSIVDFVGARGKRYFVTPPLNASQADGDESGD